LVTLEDILAEIIGELPDEHQVEERPDVRRRPDGSYLIDGTVTIRDLNRELEWNLPDEGATTIAGLVIHEAQTIPDPGQRFAFFGYKFEVLRRQRNQITALRVTPPGKNEKFPEG
jgi:Mg2+/Co2+ transporter CorB